MAEYEIVAIAGGVTSTFNVKGATGPTDARNKAKLHAQSSGVRMTIVSVRPVGTNVKHMTMRRRK